MIGVSAVGKGLDRTADRKLNSEPAERVGGSRYDSQRLGLEELPHSQVANVAKTAANGASFESVVANLRRCRSPVVARADDDTGAAHEAERTSDVKVRLDRSGCRPEHESL
jgi:hypothetical protein